MWLMTMWRLMWDVWTSAPGCSSNCSQSDKPCNCNVRKR
jgi:hypothetical protein